MKLAWNYSRRALKFPADKLQAMSGIAEFWSGRRPDDTYLAGLRHSHLPLALLWLHNQAHKLQDDTYRATSRSWASLNGMISWLEDIITNIDPDLKVTDSNIKLAHIEAPHGAVSPGSLTIQGHLSRAFLPSNARNCFEPQDTRSINLRDIVTFWDNSE